jgi:hypothetical protein
MKHLRGGGSEAFRSARKHSEARPKALGLQVLNIKAKIDVLANFLPSPNFLKLLVSFKTIFRDCHITFIYRMNQEKPPPENVHF